MIIDNKEYEEIEKKEYQSVKSHIENTARVGKKYYKLKEVYPKVFEDNAYTIEVYKDGLIKIEFKFNKDCLNFYDSIVLLKQAIAESDKIRGKK